MPTQSDPTKIAAEISRKWAERIGMGYHPDTRGADYVTAFSAKDRTEYDADMETLFGLTGIDPYEYGLEAMRDLFPEQFESPKPSEDAKLAPHIVTVSWPRGALGDARMMSSVTIDAFDPDDAWRRIAASSPEHDIVESVAAEEQPDGRWTFPR